MLIIYYSKWNDGLMSYFVNRVMSIEMKLWGVFYELLMVVLFFLQVRFYAAEVILGLEHMHNRFVVYRDLKVSNCMGAKNSA